MKAKQPMKQPMAHYKNCVSKVQKYLSLFLLFFPVKISSGDKKISMGIALWTFAVQRGRILW